MSKTSKPAPWCPALAPAPVSVALRVLGFQHEIEWGHAIVGIRPTTTLHLRAVGIFAEAGVAILSIKAGPWNLDTIPQMNEMLSVDCTVTPNTPLIFVFRVEPIAARVGISLYTALPTDIRVDCDVKTLDLMPLDSDPTLIDFQGLLWPHG